MCTSAVSAAVTLAAASCHSSSGTLGTIWTSTSKQQSKLAASGRSTSRRRNIQVCGLKAHYKEKLACFGLLSGCVSPPLSVTFFSSVFICAANSLSSSPKLPSTSSASHLVVKRDPGVSARAVLSCARQSKDVFIAMKAGRPVTSSLPFVSDHQVCQGPKDCCSTLVAYNAGNTEEIINKSGWQ